jgi:hypothetical protein
MIDQKSDEKFHVGLVTNHQINISMFETDGDALPWEEGEVLIVNHIAEVHRYDMLSIHPKSRGDSTIYEALDVGDLATAL